MANPNAVFQPIRRTDLASSAPKIGSKWYQTGLYYDATHPRGMLAGTTAPAAGTAYYYPFVVAEQASFDQIAVNVFTLAALSTVTVAIYASDANNLPAAKLFESAALDTTLTGIKTAACSISASAGKVLWIGVLTLGGAPTLLATGVASTHAISGQAAIGGNTRNCYRKTGASAVVADGSSLTSADLFTATLPLAALRSA